MDGMKHFRFTLLVVALGSAMCAQAQGSVEDIAAKVLGEKYRTAVQVIIELSKSSKHSVFDLAPSVSVGSLSGHPANEVWRLREQGMGWGQIAHQLGIHPGTFNKMRKSGAFDRDNIWISIFKGRYGMSSQDIQGIQKRGGSLKDLLPSGVISSNARVSAGAVFERYRKTHDWNATAKSFGVALRDNGRTRSTVVEDESPGNSGKAHGKGHGNPHGGPGNGHGNGHGNGNGGGDEDGD